MMKLFFLLVLAAMVFQVSAVDAQSEDQSPVWPEQVYAPYIYPNYNLSMLADELGLKYFTLAFVLDGGNCQPRWGGSTQLGQYFLLQDIERLREQGGDVIVSLGGAGGNELGLTCPDVETLTAAYQRVIDTLEVTHLDFDIEGDEIRDPESIARRSEAIASLQSTNENLVVSFTLPVIPTGLTNEGIAVLQSAIDHGVMIDIINLMTMNFGESFPSDQMGENTIQAAHSLHEQLQALYPDADPDDLWGMIGLTPMIGINDVQAEIFTLEDASLVTEFAQTQGIGLLSIWSVDRDHECISGQAALMPTCSGTLQEDYAFSIIFQAFTSTVEDE